MDIHSKGSGTGSSISREDDRFRGCFLDYRCFQVCPFQENGIEWRAFSGTPVKRSNEYFEAEAVVANREFAQYLYVEAVVASQCFAGESPLLTLGEVGVFVIGITGVRVAVDIFRTIVVTRFKGGQHFCFIGGAGVIAQDDFAGCCSGEEGLKRRSAEEYFLYDLSCVAHAIRCDKRTGDFRGNAGSDQGIAVKVFNLVIYLELGLAIASVSNIASIAEDWFSGVESVEGICPTGLDI